MAAHLTLVTLDCRPFDITTSVGEADAAVYSPAVLRLRGQPRVRVRSILSEPAWRDRPTHEGCQADRPNQEFGVEAYLCRLKRSGARHQGKSEPP